MHPIRDDESRYKKVYMKLFFISLLLIASSTSHAGLADCKNLYVGSISISQDKGLTSVVYLNNAGDESGSYWSHFTRWNESERKEILSVLLYAKATSHRVNVTTENTNGCGIQDGGTYTTAVNLTNN